MQRNINRTKINLKNNLKMNDALKYYSLIIIFYLAELYLFNLFQFLGVIQPEVTNFIIRFVMVLLTAGLLRIFVFKNKKNFFKLFLFLSLINPFLSSILLFLIYGIFGVNIIIAKIIGDVLVSLILFTTLKYFLRE